MACFVAFRYPNKAPLYIEESANPKATFRFVAFQNKSFAIKGTPVEYRYQLRDKAITGTIHNHISSKEEFTNQASQIKNILETSTTRKIVLSRIHLEEPNDIQLHDLFIKLCQTYQNELIYLAKIDESIWCGATPEILANTFSETIQTVALASTKLASENRQWTNKEILEHRYIEDFYADLAEKNKIQILAKSKVQDTQTGALLHLKSTFEFQVSKDKQEAFINQLHPTPAVSGLPQEEAIEHILNIEKHHRHWYTGYLGLETDNQAQYYVNLRCMQLGTNQSFIYVGGGHTIDSNIHAEWEETVNKSQAMRTILNKL